MKRLRVLTPSYYAIISHNYSYAIKIYYNRIKEEQLDIKEFNAKAAAYSVLLEGREFEIQKYLKYKLKNKTFDHEIVLYLDNLVKAYEFAQKNSISKKNILKIHSVSKKSILPPRFCGKFRRTDFSLKNDHLAPIYKSLSSNSIGEYFDYLVKDIEILFERELRLNQIFYYAAYIHAVFLQISPFTEGNAAIARLLEKWFIANKLDNRAWFIPSEEFYFKNKDVYFENFVKMGEDFKTRDFEQSEDFFLMLPKSIENEENGL